MANKTAVFVVGPEGSGTRLWTRLICQMGFDGSWSHIQFWDDQLPNTAKIVHRRSVPHGGEWPDLPGWLFLPGYTIRVVVCVREWYALTRSQVGIHVDTLEEAEENCREAYTAIFSAVKNKDYRVMTYESLLCNTDSVLSAMADWLESPKPNLDIYDGNAKWYASPTLDGMLDQD